MLNGTIVADKWAGVTPTTRMESPVLVLTRRLNEKLVLPGLGVTVTVLAIKGKGVRLGIQAPADIIILRDELINTDPATPH
jgi:carbon storage regulator CsrA